jgi:transmembrane protein 216
MNSSLIFEILLYLNSFYFSMFALCEFGMGLFKVVTLPYPTRNVISEFLLLLFLCCIEFVRIFMGRKGNLTERGLPVLVSIGLTLPSILGAVYFLIWQTYVLRLEVVLCAIQLTLQGLELIFALLCLASFYRAGTY